MTSPRSFMAMAAKLAIGGAAVSAASRAEQRA